MWLCFSLAALLATPTAAQDIVFTDLSPDFSDTDDQDPGGASGGRVGRLASVVGDPQRFYAASEWGGLYRTLDGGMTWEHLPGHLPPATWDVAVDPADPLRVYATSLFDGRAQSRSGISVSSDGGVTWNQPASARPPPGSCRVVADEQEPAAYGIAISPSRTVFIGTNCGLAVSSDAGATWLFRDPTPTGGADRIWDVLAGADGVVHVCGDDGHLRSEDSGATWTAGFGLAAGRCRLAASPDEPWVLFAVAGTTIYETDNALAVSGAQWSATRTNPWPQGRVPFVKVNPRGNVRGASGVYDLWFGDVSLYRVSCTTPASPAPGGAPRCGSGESPPWVGPFTRTVGGHDDVGDLAFDSQAATDACPRILSSDGGVYWNTDGSAGCHSPNWEQPVVSPHALWLFSLSGSVAEDGSGELYFGNQDNGTFGAVDVGQQAGAAPAWHNEICCDGFDTENDGAGATYSVCCFFGDQRWTKVFRSGPGLFEGQEITAYPSGGLLPAFVFPDTLQHYGEGRYVMVTRDCSPGSVGCPPGGDGGVFITMDIDANPVTWSEVGAASEPPSQDLCAVYVALDASSQPTFYAQRGTCNQDTTTDQIWRFSSAQGAWQRIFLPQGGFGVFAVHPSDPLRLMASGQTTSGGAVYRSTDGGATWTTMAQLQTLMTGAGQFPFRNRRGPTNFSGQNGYWQPSLLAFDEHSDLVIAGGQDSGLFLSEDGGTTWRLITDPHTPSISGIPHLPRPRYAVFAQSARRLFVGSQGRGVWQLDLPAGDALFRDDFETGDHSRWSTTLP